MQIGSRYRALRTMTQLPSSVECGRPRRYAHVLYQTTPIMLERKERERERGREEEREREREKERERERKREREEKKENEKKSGEEKGESAIVPDPAGEEPLVATVVSR